MTYLDSGEHGWQEVELVNMVGSNSYKYGSTS